MSTDQADTQFVAGAAQEEVDQLRDALGPLPQRGNMDREDIEPVVRGRRLL